MSDRYYVSFSIAFNEYSEKLTAFRIKQNQDIRTHN